MAPELRQRFTSIDWTAIFFAEGTSRSMVCCQTLYPR